MTGISTSTLWVYIFGTVFTDTLWQGLIIGLSLYIGIFFLKAGDARSRYNLAVVAIFAILLWTAYDIIKLILQGQQLLAMQASNSQNLFNDLRTPGTLSAFQPGTISLVFKSAYLQIGHYYYFIVPIWIAGIFLLSLRLAGGWMLAIRVRNRSVFPLSQNWENSLDYLVAKLKIGKKIILKGSFKVASPMVIGYFKPVILVPASVISSLSYSEMEAILAHELAHILRHDFLFICLQNIAEILLFYHPVTWLISSFLNKEREKCCDDIAVSLNNDSLPFAKAITLMEDLHVQKNMPASFLLGRNNDLLVRIKRILHDGIRKSSIAERMAASVIITAGLCLIFAFAGFAHNKPSASSPGKPVFERHDLASPDTLKKFSETTTVEAVLADDSSKAINSYKITYENDTVKDLVVNKKKISREQLKVYKNKLSLIKKLEMEHRFNSAKYGWNDKRQAEDLFQMANKESKLAMEKALLDMQMHQEDFMKLRNSEDLQLKLSHLQLDKLKQELMLEDFMRVSSDSLNLNQLRSNDVLFPKIDEKQMKEMKLQMEKLQKQIGEEMHKFQIEFQKTHGRMLDSLKREMEKLNLKLPMLQGNALFEMQPYLFNRDIQFDNAFNTPGSGTDFWKQTIPDTSAMEDKLRSLEK